jgi:hypothetical protein
VVPEGARIAGKTAGDGPGLAAEHALLGIARQGGGSRAAAQDGVGPGDILLLLLPLPEGDEAW